MSGMMPCTSCSPPGARREVITSSKIRMRAGLAGRLAQIGEEFRRRRDAAAAAEHRLDQDRGEVLARAARPARAVPAMSL